MDALLYLCARCAVALLQSLPLRWAARLGRAAGELAYWLDARHRRVALRNLTLCFGAEKSAADLRCIARENFRRIGESFVSAVKTASMTKDEIAACLTVVGADKVSPTGVNPPPRSCIVAIGHFGNFELFAHITEWPPHFKRATTYRGLKQPGLNRVLKMLREPSGCTFYERRTEVHALRAALNSNQLLLGLLADQHAGDRGLWVPFLGHLCSSSVAPAVFALRYNCPLFTAICFRTRLAEWRIEVGDEIPTNESGQPRTIEAITSDMNRAFEVAVRRDPANWFWVHNRWKPRNPKARRATPVVGAAAEADFADHTR